MKERVLSFNQVTAAYFDEPVLEDVTLAVYSQETVGVVGRNGSGKSTLLKCLTGIHGVDAGSVVRDRPVRFGYLPQEAELPRSATVLEAMQGALPELDRVEAELQEVEASMGLEEVYGDPARLEAAIVRQDTLVARYAELGGPSFQRTIEATLRQVGLVEESFGLQVSDLSGGQKKLLALARILVGRPHFLVLDEPDNHLDLRGKQLLERIIGAFDGGVAIVSHDRYLLDLIIDSIIELERRKVFSWPGNYSEYVIQKEVAVASQARHYQAQQKEIKRLEESAKRLLTWGAVFDNPKFITRGKSILKRIDRIDRIDAPVTDSETMDLALQYRRGSEKVLELTNVSFTFPDTGVRLFDRADLADRPYDRQADDRQQDHFAGPDRIQVFGQVTAGAVLDPVEAQALVRFMDGGQAVGQLQLHQRAGYKEPADALDGQHHVLLGGKNRVHQEHLEQD